MLFKEMSLDISILCDNLAYIFVFFTAQDVQFSYMSAHSGCWGAASCWPEEYQHKKSRFVVCFDWWNVVINCRMLSVTVISREKKLLCVFKQLLLICQYSSQSLYANLCKVLFTVFLSVVSCLCYSLSFYTFCVVLL